MEAKDFFINVSTISHFIFSQKQRYYIFFWTDCRESEEGVLKVMMVPAEQFKEQKRWSLGKATLNIMTENPLDDEKWMVSLFMQTQNVMSCVMYVSEWQLQWNCESISWIQRPSLHHAIILTCGNWICLRSDSSPQAVIFCRGISTSSRRKMVSLQIHQSPKCKNVPDPDLIVVRGEPLGCKCCPGERGVYG